MKRYKSVLKESKDLEFKSYDEFGKWLSHYRGKKTDPIKITIPNAHGNKITYSSPMDVLHSHEE